MESKTARASAVRVVKEVHIETPEEAIKAIRDNRAAGLFIGDMSRVDKLLQAYDAAIKQIVTLESSAAAQTKELQELGKSAAGLVESTLKHMSEAHGFE